MLISALWYAIHSIEFLSAENERSLNKWMMEGTASAFRKVVSKPLYDVHWYNEF